MTGSDSRFPQIKICGLTREDEAVRCAAAGADAIGLIFFPKSPRHVNDDQARGISEAVSQYGKTVGVFVNAEYGEIIRKVSYCGLSAVQLHGHESPDLVKRLSDGGIQVIKALFADAAPWLSDASRYPASAFLVECSKGPLPGGNAMTWDWSAAKAFGRNYPLILAGGLSPDNVETAIAAARPLAVDVSSGVEQLPGRKDLDKVSRFIEAVSACRRGFAQTDETSAIF
jgi:phosphoribosylanthranilate isomerase